jgi:hypothetical protein
MPLPFLLAGAAAIAGIAGLTKGGQAISNNSKAKEIMSDAEYMYDSAKRNMEYQKEATVKQLDSLGELKLLSWSEDIGTFIELFSEFKKVKLESKVNVDKLLKSNVANVGNMKQMQIASLKAAEVLKAGVSSLGAGALAGIASYGGAMMFASASTGTAIASLSGAAAANATMAWFGGGSLAAGGLGMAGGSLVLGGIVAGPVLAVAGFIMAAKSEENLANASKVYSEAKNASEKMKTITSFMESIENIAYSYENFIEQFREQYQPLMIQLKNMRNSAMSKQERLLGNRIRRVLGMKVKVDFRLLEPQEQQLLHISWLMTQVLNAVLSAPLLTKNGDLDVNAEAVLIAAEESSVKLLKKGA